MHSPLVFNYKLFTINNNICKRRFNYKIFSCGLNLKSYNTFNLSGHFSGANVRYERPFFSLKYKLRQTINRGERKKPEFLL